MKRSHSSASSLLLAGWLVAGILIATISSATEPAIFPQGVAAGDVTASSVVLWTRTAAASKVRLTLSAEGEASPVRELDLSTAAASDFTLRVPIEDLRPATHYRYHFSTPAESVTGSFRTAPAADNSQLPSFLVSGDLGGQGLCRHAERGYDIFTAMNSLEPDFFIANGDMIYADSACPENGPGGWPNVDGGFPSVVDVDWETGAALEVFRAHWRYNRADAAHREFLARTPIYVQWDDHEVINDFGGDWPSWLIEHRRAGYPRLVQEGRQALFEFNPLTTDDDNPERIYRSFRWGKELEMFLLDARSYRSFNDLVDRPANSKTLLGAEQLEWLRRGLRESTATWKLVSSDVPLSVPTGSEAGKRGRDAFANGTDSDFSARTGFEGELTELLTDLDRQDVRNIVFVVTDVHFAMSLRYHQDLDGDGDRLLFHELISGPLNAYSLPTPARLDPTFRPSILFAEGDLFNFSYIRLERRQDGVHLLADIRGVDGKPRFGSDLDLAPE